MFCFIDYAEKTEQCCKENGVPTHCRGICKSKGSKDRSKSKEQLGGLRKLTQERGCKQHFKTIVHCVRTVGLQADFDN